MVTADVAIRARPRESIYRLIYSVIIHSAIARALGDGKDSHVNARFRTFLSWRTQLGNTATIDSDLFFKAHSISSEFTRDRSVLFVPSTRTPRR